MNMFVYEFKWKESRDYVLASNKKEAIEIIRQEFYVMGMLGCEIRRLLKKEWSTHYMIDLNESVPYGDDNDEDNYLDGYRIETSFETYIEQNKFPHIIVSIT